MYRLIFLTILVVPFLGACAPDNADAQATKDAMIQDAIMAAPPSIADNATVMDWENNTLREGTNGWTCLPTPPNFPPESSPMCLDEPWLKWADAWANKKEFEIDKVGISYMLAGDSGASNIDPFATEETPDNEWVVGGPHLMILVPDPAMLEGISTDSKSGGPYVMWKGTPYAHIMVPVGDK